MAPAARLDSIVIDRFLMPRFALSKARVVLPVLIAGFIALMSAGPGTIILLAAAPSSVKPLGTIVCPAGATMNARWVRYSYNRPGESNLEITCAAENGETLGESPRWLTKLFGLYFSVLLIPLLYFSLTREGNATPSLRS